MKKATIYEIARELNIHSSTVSRALNDSPRVSVKTKTEVLEKAKELGYSANLLASNLRQNKSNTIGVVVPRISRYYFSTAIAGIEECAFAHGYNVIISQSLEYLSREKKIIKNFVANRVDGVLISISWETESGKSDNCNHLKHLYDINMPVVFYDRHCTNIPDSNKVLTSDFDGAYKAVEHLVEKGCKNIGHFAGPQSLAIYQNRLMGYKMALEANGIKINEDLIVVSNLMKLDGFHSMKKLLKKQPNIDGIFAANDESAVGAIKYLEKVGKKIPENIAFVGFSNDPMSEVVNPALTTVDEFGFELGKKACELLIKNINNKGKNLEPETIIIKSKLIERLSSQKLL